MSAPMTSRTRRGVVLVVGSNAAAPLREDYDVRIAMSGAQAVQLAGVMPRPDIVLLDADAPGVDASAVCRELRSGPRTRTIPVIIVTAAGSSSESTDDLADLADDVLSKPVDGRLLLARVGTAIRAGARRGDADDAFPAGSVVGEHRIDRKLGKGAFGEVYAATHLTTGERVALKVLAKKSARQPDVVARFVAEAKAANRIRQRNIIEVFSFGVHAETGRHYFVMELLSGETLREHLARVGRVAVADAFSILDGLAAGLDAAHDAGVTHRDLKPDNVFLAEQAGGVVVKILDFGIAKLTGDEAANRTRSGVVLGTPRYMSPEQARGKKAGPPADVYALGVIVHEMLTGQPLFAGPALDVLIQHVTDPPPAASTVNPALPPALDAPILAMLAKRPESRPETATAAIAALRSALA